MVDDEPYNLMALQVIINATDTKNCISNICDQATNGLEAYKAVKKAHEDKHFEYGLIFMDCSMPILDGYDASDKIRQYLRNNYE
jgi:CheY-like chemotaxis protein